MRRILILGAGLCCGLTGCAAPQKVVLTAAPDQQAIVRNGVPVLASNKKHLVMLRPNSRLMGGNARPAFTLIVRNQGRAPETLQEASIRAWQVIGGKHVVVRVYRYDDLMEEEQTRQKIAAFGVALVRLRPCNVGRQCWQRDHNWDGHRARSLRNDLRNLFRVDLRSGARSSRPKHCVRRDESRFRTLASPRRSQSASAGYDDPQGQHGHAR